MSAGVCRLSGMTFSPVHTLLVTDLDDTLWTWFAAWHASFSAMLSSLEELSGVPRHVLATEIKAVHQQRGTTEYSHLLNELPSLRELSGDIAPIVRFDPAIHALNSARKENTRLYPGVRETLLELKRQGVAIAAYTESLAYWTAWRVQHTELDGVIDAIYSAPDHDLPVGVSVQDLRYWPDEERYRLRRTTHRHVPAGTLKPNTAILRRILADFDKTPEETVYVGDSLMKDIAMAQDAGVHDAHAKYGEPHRQPGYDLLRQVTHWTAEAVEREKNLTVSRDIVPTTVLNRDFAQLLPVFRMRETVA